MSQTNNAYYVLNLESLYIFKVYKTFSIIIFWRYKIMSIDHWSFIDFSKWQNIINWIILRTVVWFETPCITRPIFSTTIWLWPKSVLMMYLGGRWLWRWRWRSQARFLFNRMIDRYLGRTQLEILSGRPL